MEEDARMSVSECMAKPFEKHIQCLNKLWSFHCGDSKLMVASVIFSILFILMLKLFFSGLNLPIDLNSY